MKKIIITILAMATMALAANKPVCYDETKPGKDYKWFVCDHPRKGIDTTSIFVQLDMSFVAVVNHYTDGHVRLVRGHHHNKGYGTNEYVEIIERENDEFGVWVTDTSYVVTRTLDYYYKSIRKAYDFKKKPTVRNK